ncbi:transcription termination factor 2 [Melitaea cinxia]|uniref:transcription termination factor 2 n=1 Tax=Melitaea cinxia TaxID=113334 RepID=UPI001E271DD9|nr:transcription termination factor 2 [Melitaea cinxia]
MDSSFFEYRDKSGMESDSDTEIIDNSVLDESFVPKTPGKKNQTAFVPESDDSVTEGESEEVPAHHKLSKTASRRSSVQNHIVLSSDDDQSKSSIRRQSNSSNKVVVSSSEDEEQASPEIVPRRRPIIRDSGRDSESFIGPVRKTKKRMMLLDSDTDNSIIIERDKNRKLACLKDTPAKIKDLKNTVVNIQNMSIQSNSSIQSIDEEQDSDECEESDDNSEKSLENCEKVQADEDDKNDDKVQSNDKSHSVKNDAETDSDETSNRVSTGDEGPDEDQMFMSRATRMSIMGVLPKENESDDSDYIQDDDDDTKEISRASSIASLTEPLHLETDDNTSQKTPEQDNDNTSRISCSPITSPLREVTSKNNDLTKDSNEARRPEVSSFSKLAPYSIKMKMLKNLKKESITYKESKIDDDTEQTSRASSIASLTEPLHLETDDNHTSQKTPEEDDDNTSRISCSPITSPLREVTSENNDLTKDSNEACRPEVSSFSKPAPYSIKTKMLKNLKKESITYKESKIDDDVTVIETTPEIIALSSDDEDETKDEKKSPNTKKSPNLKTEDTKKQIGSDIKQYLLPPSYPNQVVYVKKHVRENELNKLNGLREDLQNIRYLLENMDVGTLPDGGVKLIERLTALEGEVRRQGDKVAAMVVEPDEPTAEVIAKDGFESENRGLSWDDIQKASNAVQPRMFGKQAMATHMAERNRILERLRDLHSALDSRPPEHEHAAQPQAVRSALMPHQLHALAWLRWREEQRPRGGVLADDMGLGKTITMISLIVSDKEKNLDHEDEEDEPERNSRLVPGGTLVVCPASLLAQWAGEVATHCAPHALAVLAHHGAARATQPRRLAAADLVVTTYNILQRESEKGGVLTRVFWRRVILDEAHVVRNYKSATSQAVCALRASRRWALTGTPLHNKDLDLFALLKFLRCSPFDDLALWKKWIDNKSLGGQERLNTVVRCIMLRRTKAQLQERGQLACLPPRTEHSTDVTLHKDEMNVYQKLLVFSKTLFAQFLHQRTERLADTQGFLSKGKNSEYEKMHKKMVALKGVKPVKSHEILVLLLRLRQVCGHCGLIASMLDPDDTPVDEDLGSQDLLAELNKLTLNDQRSRRKSGEKEKEDELELEPGEGSTAAEAIRSVLSVNNPVFELARPSAKIRAVMDCLREHVFPNKGEKAVVVSQWTSVLSLVERELKSAKVRCVTLSGRVPVPARAPLIATLNDAHSDVRVMLLSLCAGGVGLNLVGANHLLLLDPHWNPQLEQQAQDRIFRVGQTKHVHIYRFTCLDTVEQSIRQLQKAKLELAENVLTGAKNTNASKLTIEDLKLLFNMGTNPSS